MRESGERGEGGHSISCQEVQLNWFLLKGDSGLGGVKEQRCFGG